jgi:hypothetical protein
MTASESQPVSFLTRNEMRDGYAPEYQKAFSVPPCFFRCIHPDFKCRVQPVRMYKAKWDARPAASQEIWIP